MRKAPQPLLLSPDVLTVQSPKNKQISLPTAQPEHRTQGWMLGSMARVSQVAEALEMVQSYPEWLGRGMGSQSKESREPQGQPSPASPLWFQDSSPSPQTPLPSPNPERPGDPEAGK